MKPQAPKPLSSKLLPSKLLSFAALCALSLLLYSCYQLPAPTQDALSVQIYRGKSSLKDCSYITEVTGVVNTGGYGVRLLDAISGAENDLRNKVARYGGNAALVLHTESRLVDAGYQFRSGLAESSAANKIDEYIIYGEVYRCKL